MNHAIRVIPISFDWRPENSIYASEEFLKTAGHEYGWIGGIDGLGELCCVLPYTVIRKWRFRLVRFRVETIPWKRELHIEEEKAFLNGAVNHFRSIKADMIIPATTNTIFRTYPDGAIAAPYGTYVIDLNLSEEELWKNIHSKHRNVIRNASKKGVEIRNGLEYLSAAYQLIKDTLRRSKLEFMTYLKFERFVQGLGENVKLFVAFYQGLPQGCAVVPFSRHSAYYVYGGSISSPITGAVNLLHWEAMRTFKNLEVKYYDFVGVRIKPEPCSKQESLMVFKRRFGGELKQGYIWKYAFNPAKFLLYSLAVRLLRGGDIVDHEGHKLVKQHFSETA